MESPRLFEKALDALTKHICVVDADGRIVAVNEAWRRFGEQNGCAPVYLAPGSSYYDACDPEGVDGGIAAQAMAGIERVLTGRVTRFDLDYPCHSPTEERWFILRVTAIADGPGRYAVIAHENVTDRVVDHRKVERLEEQFRHAQKMEAVGRLAAGVAHDFNNLLMGIRGSCELGRRRSSNAVSRAVFDDIARAALGGSAIVEQLMAFSRRESSAAKSAELDEVIRRNANLFTRVLGEDVALELELDAAGRWVPFEIGHLDQILLNLLINAREAMPGGGRLLVRTRADGDGSRIEVEDSGVGMDAQTRARIFEPFFTTRETGEGTGLGLSTVYGLVHAAGGQIEVRSAPGRGTCFALRLPAAAPPEPSSEDSAPTVPPEGEARTALVVEDEALVRLTVRMYLEDAGYRVLEAEDAEGAVAVAAQCRHLDLILSDIVLPGGAGPQIVADVREHHPGAAVLFMSAYPNALLVEQGRIEQGMPSIQKPFDEAVLFDAIRALGTEAL